jgi:hypothetical protein
MINGDIDYRNRAYEAFAQEAANNGYAKAEPEEIVLQSDVTYDVQGGVAGSDTGSPATKVFFNSTSSDAVVQSQDPPIKYQQQLGGEFLMCVFAYALHWDAQAYAGTLAETREVNGALARALLSLQFGSDRVFMENGRACTWFGQGLPVGSDGSNGGGASLASRGESFQVDYRDMSSPRVLGSTQQLLAQHQVSKATWTTDDDFTLSLRLKAFLARKS